jgi:hypothetical protein
MNFISVIYKRLSHQHGQKTSFIILASFLLSFIVARMYVYLSLETALPVLTIKGVHIHHLNFGIAFLVVSGFLALYFSNTRFHKRIAFLYGVGLGLTFDEFGMWLHLEDNYWVRQSYDSIIIITLILANMVFFGNLWLRFFRKIAFYINKIQYKYFNGGLKDKNKQPLS